MSLTNEQKLERGWFYVGKIKYYARKCDNCNEEYIGQGSNFCSRDCSANLKIVEHDDGTQSVESRKRSTGHNYGEAISAGKKGKPVHPNSIEAIRKSRKGCTLTEEHKRKCSEALSGDKHWAWKKDRSLLKKSEKKHLDSRYREWSMEVKNRDLWKCSMLDKECQGRLEAHHIFDWVNYPELRYKLKNGITLCRAHHPRGRANEAKLRDFFVELVESNSDLI